MLRPILIVEDFEDDIFQLVRTLKKAQVENEIHSVKNGQQAVAYLQGNGIYSDREKFPLPGLIFLDLYMSGPDGFSVLQFIRSNADFESIPVVILTGSVALSDVTKAYELGAIAFLSKPCREDDLKKLPPAATQWLRFTSPDPS